MFKRHHLLAAWQNTLDVFPKITQVQGLLGRVSLQPEQIVPILARLIVAMTLARAEEQENVIVDGLVRDRAVELVIEAFGGRIAGVADVFLKPAATLAGFILNPVVRWRTRARRADLTDVSTPIADDILAYQGRRGEDLRAYIADHIHAAQENNVVLMAHSLGGIACVELLIDRSIPRVTHLVTVGSQAPFFYEMNILNKLEYGQPLPGHFPRNWLNIYDPHDILAYRAKNVFPKSCHVFVQDLEVDNGQPFPQSHRSYWTNKSVWEELDVFLKRP